MFRHYNIIDVWAFYNINIYSTGQWSYFYLNIKARFFSAVNRTWNSIKTTFSSGQLRSHGILSAPCANGFPFKRGQVNLKFPGEIHDISIFSIVPNSIILCFNFFLYIYTFTPNSPCSSASILPILTISLFLYFAIHKPFPSSLYSLPL